MSNQVLGGEPRIGFSGRLWWNSSVATIPEGVLRIGQILDAGLGNAVLFAPCLAIYWYIGICLWAHERVSKSPMTLFADFSFQYDLFIIYDTFANFFLTQSFSKISIIKVESQ